VASFDEVAEQLSGKLRAYLERMVGNPTEVDDLLQETLIKIERGLPGFQGRSSLETWSFTIATRVAADHFRRPEARARIVEMEENDASEDPADAGPDVGERLIIKEMNSCIRGVIDSLPEDYRAALVLHDLQGLTANETAAVCGCSLATAKIRIHRARKRLQQALEKECTFYRDREDVLRCDRKPGNGEEPR
jgi:RNA polymerase sigma-70 factor (ECF subfamily)